VQINTQIVYKALKVFRKENKVNILKDFKVKNFRYLTRYCILYDLIDELKFLVIFCNVYNIIYYYKVVKEHVRDFNDK